MFTRAAAVLLTVVTACHAANPFARGSDVVTLTPQNWKELERSPLPWFVNVCREG